MDPHDMAEWAYSHACDKCHAGEACEIDACINAREIADFLRRVERVETKDQSGRTLQGWYVPDKV